MISRELRLQLKKQFLGFLCIGYVAGLALSKMAVDFLFEKPYWQMAVSLLAFWVVAAILLHLRKKLLISLVSELPAKQ